MTLPASGIIKLSDIAAEFGYGNALSGYVGKTWYTDAGGTGTFASTLKLSDFNGKRKTAPVFKFNVSSNVNKAVMSTLAYNAGWDGLLPLECTINSGVTIYSDDPTIVALWFNVPCTLINKGLILGASGVGGKGGTIHGSKGNVPLVGGAGGAAMGGDAYISVDNQGVICGGAGGGGGGGSARYYDLPNTYACGGGGGGAGPYGAPGAGGTGTLDSNTYRRDGSAGAASGYYYAAGAGGAGGYADGPGKRAGAGGASGSYASAGAYGANPDSGSIWSSSGRAGGAGGAAVANNSYITWINTGTRYGAIT